ncbi:hypothetical protein DSM104299_03199 [Baekduia alba]|nr:hypothetical protein DSM104299_03199 [Baekduia alba]
MFVKEVDERALSDGERIFRPEDALAAAAELFRFTEFRKLDPRMQDRVGVDVVLPRWEDQSAGTQWVFMHRAMEALHGAEVQRRRPVEGAVLDPVQPAGEL